MSEYFTLHGVTYRAYTTTGRFYRNGIEISADEYRAAVASTFTHSRH